MKLVSLIFGFVIFSVVLSMMFASVGDILDKNNSSDAATFTALSGEYEDFTRKIKDDGSTTRNIIDQSKQGAATSETTDVTLLSGALSGGKLTTNFFVNFDNILNNATGDINKGEAYIDNRIVGGILALIVVFLAFVALHFLRGFKTET